jgi:hypothetical protein
MFRFSSPVTLRLGRGELMTWKQGLARVRVVSGCAWVTQRGDPEDHFLHAGQSFELRHNASALIGAEQDVSLRFETPAHWSRTLLRRLRFSAVWCAPARASGQPG